jgi:hypothetical protein
VVVRIPFNFVGDYRGHSAGGEFVNNDGERIEYSDGLKFEVDLPDGDVDLVVVRANKLAEVAAFNLSTLSKGQRVAMVGVVTSSEYQGQSRVSMVVLKADLAEPVAVSMPAAKSEPGPVKSTQSAA